MAVQNIRSILHLGNIKERELLVLDYFRSFNKFGFVKSVVILLTIEEFNCYLNLFYPY